MNIATEERVREICLALPEASERKTWGDPTFRVRDKIFAMVKRGDGRLSIWCKASPGVQEALIASKPDRFFRPPYVGHVGWIGVRLDGDVDWAELGDQIAEGYYLTAPKQLVAQVRSSNR